MAAIQICKQWKMQSSATGILCKFLRISLVLLFVVLQLTMVDRSISSPDWSLSEKSHPSTSIISSPKFTAVKIITRIKFGNLLTSIRSFSEGSVTQTDEISRSPMSQTASESEERSPPRDEQVKLESERGRWPNQCEFLLSLIGFTIGYGNFARFPALAQKYDGGAFLIPYFIAIFVLGLPLIYLELLLGQYISRGPIRIFVSVAPIFQGVGWAAISVSAILAVFHPSFIAWAYIYLINSFRNQLPWSTCSNAWNTDKCYSIRDNDACAHELGDQRAFMSSGKCYSNSTNSTAFQIYSQQLNNNSLQSAAVQFFDYYIYDVSSDSQLQWQLCLATLTAWILCFFCAIRGFRSFGLTIYFLASFPFVTLFILLISALTRDGAQEGLKIFLRPKISELAKFDVWHQAAIQLIYSTSIGRGVLSTTASFNDLDQGLLKHTILLSLADAVASLMAGFVVFGNLGYLAKQLNKEPNSFIANGGVHVQFVLSIYVDAVSSLPGAQAWSVLLFLMFACLGLVLLFITTDTLVTNICDYKPILRTYRPWITAAVCVFYYLIGLPFCAKNGLYLLSVLDNSLPFAKCYVCLLEIVCVIWVYGYPKWAKNIREMKQDVRGSVGRVLHYYWCTTWSVLTPLTLIILIVVGLATYKRQTYIAGAQGTFTTTAIATFFMFLPLLLTLGFGVVQLIGRLKHNKPLTPLFEPTEYWKPEYFRDRSDGYEKTEPGTALLDLKKTPMIS